MSSRCPTQGRSQGPEEGLDLTDTIRRQFTAEADAMAALPDHPTIVPVFAAEIAADGA